MVYDENNNPISKAEISVAGINHDVTAGNRDFWCICGCYFFFLIGVEAGFMVTDCLVSQPVK